MDIDLYQLREEYATEDLRVVDLIDSIERTQGLRSSLPMQPGDPAEPRELVGALLHQVWNEAQAAIPAHYNFRDWDQMSPELRETCMRVGAALWSRAQEVETERTGALLAQIRSLQTIVQALHRAIEGSTPGLLDDVEEHLDAGTAAEFHLTVASAS